MKLLATIIKEALILLRDRSGLAVIFLMPTVLAMIVVVVQDQAFDIVKGSPIPILFLDKDGGSFGRGMREGLAGSEQFTLVTRLDDGPLTEDRARLAVQRGDRQICVVVPKGTSAAASKRAGQVVAEMLKPSIRPQSPPGAADGSASQSHNADTGGAESSIIVYLDPGISGVYRNSVINSFHRLSQGLEMQMILETLRAQTSPKTVPLQPTPVDVWKPGDLVGLKEVVAGRPFAENMPTAAQQNVPAWALFAMFLTVLPLSGSIVRERQDGTFVRLRTLPVSYWTILTGKIAVYVGICLCQFAFMMLLGWWVMPLLGVSQLEVHSSFAAIAIVAVASALAASGYGMLVGAFARTNAQASVFGATFVVIAAALGGIMVPLFLMPEPLQAISRLSPLQWALNAFLALFLRQGNLGTIWPDILRLTGFFAATMLLAVVRLRGEG